MLRSVVTAAPAGSPRSPGTTRPGKTGTAWKRQPGGGYLDSNGIRQYQSTFVGVVPAEQPALSVYVMIDEPKSGEYTGGATAAPAFSKLGRSPCGGWASRRPRPMPANGGAAVRTTSSRVSPPVASPPDR